MPNIQALMVSEIARVARKELRAEIAPLQKAVATYRRQIAALRRQVATLERTTSRAARSKPEAATTREEEQDGPALRFSAAGLRKHRQRLGLSAADVAQLLGVSGLSIYKWESGKTRPRAVQIEKIAQLRTMGKREALAKLEELATAQAKTSSRKRQAAAR